mmetsp:Transcript_16382/g.33745  ORF Transcript_16382/g.33745 Transcript_16382/m.33745 type:complete len:102 (+) Transcript_16382:143-448(+)
MEWVSNTNIKMGRKTQHNTTQHESGAMDRRQDSIIQHNVALYGMALYGIDVTSCHSFVNRKQDANETSTRIDTVVPDCLACMMFLRPVPSRLFRGIVDCRL